MNKKIAKELNIPIVFDLKDYFFVKNKKIKIPYFFAKKNLILPVEEKDGSIVVAVCNVLDLSSLKEISLLLKKEVKTIFTSEENIKKAIERCYSKNNKNTFSYQKEKKEVKLEKRVEEYDLLDSFSDSPTINILNAIILEAINQNASDIHFEPKEKDLEIRYRIDGVLQKKNFSSNQLQHQLITRIKVLANLDIAENRRPQDGRMKLKISSREIDFRVSTIPIIHGERVVLRILDKENIVLGLENLGMNDNVLKAFRKLISIPEGIVLVTGPTGSGKTTTLYSAILEINSLDKNIMTIEDPVEYKLENISQIGVNPKIGLSFASGLRHILRQDPDIIMLGEIRDLETAEIAIQSSLTGHLVLSTLHTNDAFSALTRLSDMGIEPYLLASSISGVLAQRLVRKICPYCKKKYMADETEKSIFKIEKKVFFYKGTGCSKCFYTGYSKRIGIYELMMVDSFIKKQIMKSVDRDLICQISKRQKLDTLLESGKKLVLSGVTTSFEIFRVIKMER